MCLSSEDKILYADLSEILKQPWKQQKKSGLFFPERFERAASLVTLIIHKVGKEEEEDAEEEEEKNLYKVPHHRQVLSGKKGLIRSGRKKEKERMHLFFHHQISKLFIFFIN